MRYNDGRSIQRLEDAVAELIQNPQQSSCDNIKRALNEIFGDTAICKEVIYTNNPNKMFFGMVVMPILTDRETESIMMNANDRTKVTQYAIEIDSKLIESGELHLTPSQVTACILHEVGHIVIDINSVEEVRRALNVYLAGVDDVLRPRTIHNNIDIMSFAISDAIRKVGTLFNKNMNEELVADKFVVACGYGEDLEDAYRIISKKSLNLNNDINNKFVVLQWSLNINKNMGLMRASTLSSLNKSKSVESSKLTNRNINAMINNISRSSHFRESANSINEGFRDFINSLSTKYRYNALAALEDELYEYTLKVKSVDDKDEAMVLLKEINSRLSILEEYIIDGEIRDDKNYKRSIELMTKYKKLRDELMKKDTYDEKYYGLFVQTPVIRSRYEL